MTDWRRLACAVAGLGLTLSLCGCPPVAPPAPPPPAMGGRDVGAEQLYPVGTYRSDLENRYGPAKLNWTLDTVPDDEFAESTMREMIAARKSRPASYQVFTVRRLEGREYFRDYVFYNLQGRVMYVARRAA